LDKIRLSKNNRKEKKKNKIFFKDKWCLKRDRDKMWVAMSIKIYIKKSNTREASMFTLSTFGHNLVSVYTARYIFWRSKKETN